MSLKQVAEALVARQNATTFRAEVAQTKFRNVKTIVDGITFASKFEAHRWTELRLMEKAGMIRKLQRQRAFALTVNEYPICQYWADFVYEEEQSIGAERSWQRIVEDTKGIKGGTEAFRLKKKLMLACLGIEIRIVLKEHGGR